MKKFLLAVILTALTTFTYAQHHGPRNVPARKTPIPVVQPNGDTLIILKRGDEWHHFTMTVDGYLIGQQDNGYYYYLTYTPKGELVAGKYKAKNADKRSKREKKYLNKNIPNRLEEPKKTTRE
ncbi:MAG: hypothetical protein IJS73_03010 [Paludibacteraceae bacterium]|nr:hypothetical protein [Paludibacteraceae bacterium]